MFTYIFLFAVTNLYIIPFYFTDYLEKIVVNLLIPYINYVYKIKNIKKTINVQLLEKTSNWSFTFDENGKLYIIGTNENEQKISNETKITIQSLITFIYQLKDQLYNKLKSEKKKVSEPVLEEKEPEPVLEEKEPEPVLEEKEPEPVLEEKEPKPVLEEKEIQVLVLEEKELVLEEKEIQVPVIEEEKVPEVKEVLEKKELLLEISQYDMVIKEADEADEAIESEDSDSVIVDK